MKRIVYKRPDGGVSIIVPNINTFPQSEGLTEDQALDRAKKDIPVGATEIIIVEEGDIPVDRTYRDSWTHNGSKVVHDMTKARNIHRQSMRHIRKDILAALDVRYTIADESGDVAAKKAIADKKRELRDVTAHPDIEAAETVEQLKAVWPECLGASK